MVHVLFFSVLGAQLEETKVCISLPGNLQVQAVMGW